MFDNVKAVPPDPILGLSEAFRDDSNPDKINLGVGVYRDATGQTPVLDVVREAERRLLANQQTKSYLPIDGATDRGKGLESHSGHGPEMPTVHEGKGHPPGVQVSAIERVAGRRIRLVEGVTDGPVLQTSESWQRSPLGMGGPVGGRIDPSPSEPHITVLHVPRCDR